MAAKTRKYKPASEQIILDRLAAGTLRVDLETGVVEVLHPHHSVWPGQWREPHMKPSGRTDQYRVFKLYLKNSRREVRLHRAVWIAGTGELIPDGCEIHHKDEDPENNAYSNLELLESEQHRNHHNGNGDADYDDF